jgi:DNA-binding transcriptional MerR regulator
MDRTENLLKIGDFARLAGTNLRTLRYYEELGLMSPAWRSEGGFRYYRKTDLNRLGMATRDSGLSRQEFVQRVRRALTEQDRLIRARIEDLEGQRSKIASAVEKLGQCESCPQHPNEGNNFCEPCAHTGTALPEHLSALF